MKNIYKIIRLLLLLCFVAACEEVSDMAIDRQAAPLLAVFGEVDTVQQELLSFKATFYELDKSGILDQHVGIDSMPVANMPVVVYINESDRLGELTTNANGEVFFEREISMLEGTTRLEWTGRHKEVPFRIYQNF